MPIFVLIIINSILFGLQNLNPYFTSSFYKNNLAIAQGEWYRLVTSNYLHGDIFHLLFNMYSLQQAGTLVVNLFGVLNFGIIYTVGGICGSLFSYFFSNANSLGASGAIFAILGAIFSYYLKNGINPSALIPIIALNLIYGFLPGSQIDNFGHIGGLLSGAMLGLILNSK
jgi:rhomboid protease GluP